MSIHVLSETNTNPASDYAVDRDAKPCRWLLSYRPLQEFVCVIDRVRMREAIAQLEPDFSIVRVLSERLRIIQSPRTNRAALQDQLERHCIAAGAGFEHRGFEGRNGEYRARERAIAARTSRFCGLQRR